MEGPRPAERIRHSCGLWPERLRRDALDPALHFGGSAARKREQHHSTRVGSRDDQMCYATGESTGLARASARDDQKGWRFGERLASILDGTGLFGVELCKIGRGHGAPATLRVIYRLV
jgi:hypothetical protein